MANWREYPKMRKAVVELIDKSYRKGCKESPYGDNYDPGFVGEYFSGKMVFKMGLWQVLRRRYPFEADIIKR